MTMKVAKWTIDEYHRMIDAGILRDRKVELVKGKIVERVSCATLAYSLISVKFMRYCLTKTHCSIAW